MKDESGEPPIDEEVSAEREDVEDHAYLAREFMTWLLFHCSTDNVEFPAAGSRSACNILFGGKVVLRTPIGEVTEMTLKGASPSSSPDLLYALAGGLSVKEADLKLVAGDKEFQFCLASTYFDLKRVKLPALLTEEKDDREDEQVALLQELDDLLYGAFSMFLGLRNSKKWAVRTVPAMRTWIEEGMRTS